MEKDFNGYIASYKAALKGGEVQTAYEKLVKYVMTLKSEYEKAFPGQFSFGNVSPGYMDFTYFPYYNDFLQTQKLRFGIVLNHQSMRFELWLMGRNIGIQKKYWELLKHTEWNKEQLTMPKYSVLEVVLVETPDFNELSLLSSDICKTAKRITDDVTAYLISLS